MPSQRAIAGPTTSDIKSTVAQADIPIRKVTGNGYIHHGYRIVPVPNKSRHLSNGESSIAEHRLVMAKHLGGPLRADENVHHINGDKLDNRLENLELWSTSQPSGKRVEDLLEYTPKSSWIATRTRSTIRSGTPIGSARSRKPLLSRGFLGSPEEI